MLFSNVRGKKIPALKLKSVESAKIPVHNIGKLESLQVIEFYGAQNKYCQARRFSKIKM